MMNEYKSLAVQYLAGTIKISQPAPPGPVALDSPASEVMTDLRRIRAAVIAPDVPMEIANTYMMQRGVRTLLVINDNESLAGIITATDILGEKPVRFIQERGIKHSEILVIDVMTPLEKLEAISPRICGIFSWTQIEKQLDTVITPNNVAKSFAEIESTLIAH